MLEVEHLANEAMYIQMFIRKLKKYMFELVKCDHQFQKYMPHFLWFDEVDEDDNHTVTVIVDEDEDEDDLFVAPTII